MRYAFLFLMLIFGFQNILASCTENQIDINTASLDELDNLTGIGPAKAQEIVNSRPFTNVDDLIKVKGIGEVTLSNIKSQGLACVSKSAEAQAEKSQNENKTEVDSKEAKNNSPYENLNGGNNSESQKTQDTIPQPEVIKLESKNIKRDVSGMSDTKRYATYGLVAFVLFLALLFAIKKDKTKNEIV